MPLSAGDKLGPYEIRSLIGAGGMGEVYRAHDPRLGRNVAIKVSAQQFSDRFEREARAIAALNHSHICQVYGRQRWKRFRNVLVWKEGCKYLKLLAPHPGH